MTRLRVLAPVVTLLALLSVGLLVADAQANSITFKFVNNSGLARSDFHLECSGTGGGATLTVITNAPGCAAPTVTNPGTPWDITWSGACVDPGEFIEVRIDNPNGDARFVSAYWTPGTPGQFPATPSAAFPGYSTVGLIAMALLMVVTGIWWQRRRTAAGLA